MTVDIRRYKATAVSLIRDCRPWRVNPPAFHGHSVPNRLYLRRLRQITTAPKSQRVYHKTLGLVFSCLFVFPFNFACGVFVDRRFRDICAGLRLWTLFWSPCFMVRCKSLFVVRDYGILLFCLDKV